MNKPLSMRALVMSIQAVDAEIRTILNAVKGKHEDLDLDSAAILEEYTDTAEELKEIYLEKQKTLINLAPYEQLIGPRENR